MPPGFVDNARPTHMLADSPVPWSVRQFHPSTILAGASGLSLRLAGHVMRGMSQTLPLFFHPLVCRILGPSPTRARQREPHLHILTDLALVVDARNAQSNGASAQSRRSRYVRGGPSHGEELPSRSPPPTLAVCLIRLSPPYIRRRLNYTDLRIGSATPDYKRREHSTSRGDGYVRQLPKGDGADNRCTGRN